MLNIKFWRKGLIPKLQMHLVGYCRRYKLNKLFEMEFMFKAYSSLNTRLGF